MTIYNREITVGEYKAILRERFEQKASPELRAALDSFDEIPDETPLNEATPKVPPEIRTRYPGTNFN